METNMGITTHSHYPKNRQGRDFFVGDIHGKFEILYQGLEKLAFNTEMDRLFSTGDLIDRGEASYQCLLLARSEWFIPVLGNHELFLLQCDDNESGIWQLNGGVWWQALSSDEKRLAKETILEHYHLTLSVDTPIGQVGVVHSQFPLKEWPFTIDDINQPNIFELLWERDVVWQEESQEIQGIDYLVSGHTPIKTPFLKGQQLFIDTGCGHEPYATIPDPRLTFCEFSKEKICLHSFNGKEYQQSKIVLE